MIRVSTPEDRAIRGRNPSAEREAKTLVLLGRSNPPQLLHSREKNYSLRRVADWHKCDKSNQGCGRVGGWSPGGQTLSAHSLLRFFLLSFFQGTLKPKRIVAGLDNVSLIGNAIKQGLTQPGIGKNLCPFRERQISGDN